MTTSVSSSTSGNTTSSSVSASNSVASSGNDLQVQFINLLVAEIQHQDPTNPMDASQYVSQLSQLSSLQSMEKLSDLQSTSNDELTQISLLAATNMVGKNATVPASAVTLDSSGTMTGQVILDNSADKVTVKLYNSSGNVIDTKTVTNASAGTVDFNFSNLAAGNYTLGATATTGQTSAILNTYINRDVEKVSLSDGSVKVDIAGVGAVDLSKVLSVSNN